MNNINNIVSIINEYGGAASLEDILSAYVKQWHILPVAENKQKIKSTLISYNGKKVFFDKETEQWLTEKPSKNTPSKSYYGKQLKSHTSELSKNVSAEKFELIFKYFMRQADENAISKKSNGGKKSKYLDNCYFDGANFYTQYGQGAATKTPHINWWVLSIYYLPDTGEITMGIEEFRYRHLNKMNPIAHKFVGNKKERVAVFYETMKDTIDYNELYEVFIDVSEEIMRLGIVDYNTDNTD